jgi:membrane protein DedA with SNARE-associated domain
VIWAITYVSVGSAAAGTYRELADRLHYAGYVFVGIIAGFLLLIFVAKKLLNRSQERHMNRTGDGDANTTDDE